MRNFQTIARCTLISALSILFITCGKQTNEPYPEGRILLENDEAVLSTRVIYFDDEQPSVGKQSGANYLQNTAPIRLVLRAEVYPPIIDGKYLHASHVTLLDDNAYVSYSTLNAQYRGGVEIFNTFDSFRPFVRSQALFLDTDVSIVLQDGNKIFLGEAVDSDHNDNFETPAGLEIIDLENGRLTTRSQQVDLPGYNGNDVACFDNAVFVASGSTNGALSVFRNHTLDLLTQIDFERAKAISRTEQSILVLEGAGVNLHLYDRSSYAFVKTITLGCTNNIQAKAEMVVDGDFAYISAYECGVFRVNLITDEVRLVVPTPEGGHTNGVSISNGRLFVANGTSGLYVAGIDGDNFEELFQVRFEGSTNFVAAKDDVVFVANGAGGLKILELQILVEDIEIAGSANVRADRGNSGYAAINAASVRIATPGLYKVESLVWYDSGDEQKNESLYLEFRGGGLVLPENPNAGSRKVVPDDPGPEHTIYRDSGTFRLDAGAYKIDVYHYAKISGLFPQFLNGSMSGAESAHVRGFKLIFVGE